MPTTAHQVDLWRQAPSEHQRLEFKEAKNQYDTRKLQSYCVAIANEGGGHLLLGIADAPPRTVVGTAAFPNLISAAEMIFNAVGFRVDIDEVAHPDGRVLVFHIPSRPKGTAYHLGGAYLMRSGQELVPMSEDHLRRIFAEGAPDWLEEHAASGLSAQEVMDSLDTQTFFELLKLPYPGNREAVLDRLISEQLVDAISDGTYSIRRMGALLLARRLSDFKHVARKAPRVVVYTGDSKLETRLDRSAASGYAVGFQRLVRFIMSQLPQNEVIEDALRREVKLVSEIVIRELAANALIHQDFTISGASVMFEIYGNRIEISNPGDPVVPVDRFIDGYQSRNERLADLMRRFGICEEKSSGIDRVVHDAEVFQLPAPDFRNPHRRTIVTIFGPRPFEEMNRDDRIRACYQHCVLRYITSEWMTNQSLRDRFKLSEARSATVSQIIAATIDASLIKPEKVGGSRKYARYLPYWA
jgi:ATP-dependent DNA helicase RecG